MNRTGAHILTHGRMRFDECEDGIGRGIARVHERVADQAVERLAVIGSRVVRQALEKRDEFGFARAGYARCDGERIEVESGGFQVFIEEVRAANRMARHNVYAYVMRDANGGPGRTRYSDDGEPQKTAGLPTLSVLQGAGLQDVVCVTTRYFGGVLLGTGGLVRAYSQAAQEAVARAETVTISRCVDATCRVPYALYDQFAKLVEESGAKMQDAAWTDAVTCRVRMLDGTQDAFSVAVSELSRGTVMPEVSEPFDAAF